jgi:hypothetical protein
MRYILSIQKILESIPSPLSYLNVQRASVSRKNPFLPNPIHGDKLRDSKTLLKMVMELVKRIPNYIPSQPSTII